MRCWGWFDDNKMADWMFIAGEWTIRLNKNPVPGGCFKDERQKWQKLACFKGWQTALRSPDPLPCQPGVKAAQWWAQPLLSKVVHGNTAPALGDPLACCQVVFVYMVLICAHVWCMSGSFSVTLLMVWKSCEASAFIFEMILYTRAQLL